MLLNEEISNGLAPDGRGRWAVDSILAWRGGADDRVALVRLSGFDPTTGEPCLPWADSWEPRGALTSDLREGGHIRRRRTAAEISEEEQRARVDWDERHTHARKSQRLRGGRIQRRRTSRMYRSRLNMIIDQLSVKCMYVCSDGCCALEPSGESA